ncbi:MAG: hypothetical protein IIC49_03410, partial [Planctomycetes bacterium]|nr:hypothetical protein [Planctomycetota bacterium]
MPKENGKSTGRGANSRAAGRSRRRTGRKRQPAAIQLWHRALRSPNFGWACATSLVFVLAVGSVSWWTREQPLVAVGRVMDRTKLARLEFELPDLRSTENARQQARNGTPRIYKAASDAALAQIKAELNNLPKTLADVSSLEELSDDVRLKFALTDDKLAALKTQVEDGEPSASWTERIDRFMESLTRTPMLSGADLAALVNEAAIIATLEDKDAVEQDDLEEARDKVRWGRAKKSRVVDEWDRKTTAYHEAGHALIQALEKEADPVHKVSIIPRGESLGATFSLPEKNRVTFNRKFTEATLRVLCAGRIAEAVLGADTNS